MAGLHGHVRPGAGLRPHLRLAGHDDGQARVDLELGQARAQVLAGQHAGRAGVGDHVRDAARRIGRVDRQVGGTGLDHAEQRHHQLDPAIEDGGHDGLGPDAEADQASCHLVGPPVQFGVRELHVTAGQGNRVGGAGDLRLEQPDDRRARYGGGGVVPAGEHEPTFGVAEHVHRAEPQAGVGRQGGQHPDQALGDALDRGTVEQVGRADDRATQTRRAAVRVERLAEADVQVELDHGRVLPSRLAAAGTAAGVQAGQVEAGARGVLQQQHHLEERVPGQRPGRRQLLDQALERDVGVGERAEPGLPDPGEHLAERGVA